MNMKEAEKFLGKCYFYVMKKASPNTRLFIKLYILVSESEERKLRRLKLENSYCGRVLSLVFRKVIKYRQCEAPLERHHSCAFSFNMAQITVSFSLSLGNHKKYI